jgi:hypothetical protein
VSTATHTGPQNMQQDTFPSRTIDPKSRVSQPTCCQQANLINRYPQHPLAFACSWQCHQHPIDSSMARCMRPQQLRIVRLEAARLRTPFSHNLVTQSQLEYGLRTAISADLLQLSPQELLSSRGPKFHDAGRVGHQAPGPGTELDKTSPHGSQPLA